MDQTYIIKCADCGIVANNHSPLYCDDCGEPITKIKLGDSWYDTNELDEDNPYNFR